MVFILCKPYVLLENNIERSSLLNTQYKKRSQSILLLCCIDSLTSENFQMADGEIAL